MANMTESAKRYRLQVPAADESVQKWLAAQINISNSFTEREDETPRLPNNLWKLL